MCSDMRTVKSFELSLVTWLLVIGSSSILASDESVEMRRYRCGYNAVYILLRISGISCDYDDLKIDRNSGKEGNSVKELVDELTRCGLPSRALQCEHPTEIRMLSAPFIIYTNPDRSGKTIGHFLVVTRVDTETINLIDGTTGEHKQYAIDRLGNIWDGWAITPATNQTKLRWIIGAVLATLGLITVAGPSVWRRKINVR